MCKKGTETESESQIWPMGDILRDRVGCGEQFITHRHRDEKSTLE